MKTKNPEKVQVVLSDVLSKYSRFKRSVFAVLVLLAAALVCAFFNRRATFAFLGLALVFHLLYVRKQQNACTRSISRANISLTVMPRLGAEDVTFRSTGGLTSSTIKRAGMMPCDEPPSFFWGMEGNAGDLHVQVSDVSIPQRFELKKGGKKRVHFNTGAWTHIVLPADTGYRYCVIDETAVPTPIRMAYFGRNPAMFHAELGDPDLKGKAVFYRPMNEEEQCPSPAVMKELRRLFTYTPGYIAMSLHGRELDLFIRGRFLAGPVTVSQKPTEASLTFDPFPELDHILRIASVCSRELLPPESAAESVTDPDYKDTSPE